jgi:hypothetical protein
VENAFAIDGTDRFPLQGYKYYPSGRRDIGRPKKKKGGRRHTNGRKCRTKMSNNLRFYPDI